MESQTKTQVPPSRPTQTEVDRLASFVEAAEELAREPFFGPDEPRSKISIGEERLFEVGDRFHFRSALISFRRIWLNDEPSNAYRICKLLKRYAHNGYDLWRIAQVAERLATFERHTDDAVTGLSRRELIDVWLNTVFAHSGLKPPRRGKKRLTRSDFDRLSKQCGHGHFEYAFRMAVWMIGTQYIGLAQEIARPALAGWQKEFSLKPTFEIGAAFGTAFEQKTREGHTMIRKGSSEFHHDETFEERFARILSRDHFGGLSLALRNLGEGRLSPIPLVQQCDSFQSCVKMRGLHLQIREGGIGQDMKTYGSKAYTTLHRDNDWKVSHLHITATAVITNALGLEIIEKLFARFKQDVFDTKPKRFTPFSPSLYSDVE